jgi:hypothetical protein
MQGVEFTTRGLRLILGASASPADLNRSIALAPGTTGIGPAVDVAILSAPITTPSVHLTPTRTVTSALGRCCWLSSQDRHYRLTLREC